MKKVLWDVVVIIYILIAVFITVCLLSYNDYNVTEFGDKLLVVVYDKGYDAYKKNDLLIVNKSDKYKVDNKVFYCVERASVYSIGYGNVDKINDSVVVVDGEVIDKDMVIGTSLDVKVFSCVGGVLACLESKWGYLCFIILPILLAFIYEIVSIIRELKKGK